ncbi:MAG: serine/threonine protein kinase [Myxococcales bacterium]|nr:serine/threonine protein kinase [Myxococcales bacterium]
MVTSAKISDPPRGNLFGKYRLIKRLGVGGMAEVFLATMGSASSSDQPLVVLKRILPTHNSDANFVRMFMEEGQLCLNLRHPNIVAVHESDQIDGKHYMSMEHVAGSDLLHTLVTCGQKQIGLPAYISLFIICEALKGLDYAHRLTDRDGQPYGIVHRDFSPSNILISLNGEVKLTDFGIAKACTRAKTNAGILKGKFGYMAPEQILGSEVDHRADVYAAGVVLFELLTGQRLYAGQDELSVLENIRNAVGPPSLRQYLHDVDTELEDIVHRALARNPRYRFQTANALHNTLFNYLYRAQVEVDSTILSNFMHQLFDFDRLSAPGLSSNPQTVDLGNYLVDEHITNSREVVSLLSTPTNISAHQPNLPILTATSVGQLNMTPPVVLEPNIETPQSSEDRAEIPTSIGFPPTSKARTAPKQVDQQKAYDLHITDADIIKHDLLAEHPSASTSALQAPASPPSYPSIVTPTPQPIAQSVDISQSPPAAPQNQSASWLTSSDDYKDDYKVELQAKLTALPPVLTGELLSFSVPRDESEAYLPSAISLLLALGICIIGIAVFAASFQQSSASDLRSLSHQAFRPIPNPGDGTINPLNKSSAIIPGNRGRQSRNVGKIEVAPPPPNTPIERRKTRKRRKQAKRNLAELRTQQPRRRLDRKARKARSKLAAQGEGQISIQCSKETELRLNSKERYVLSLPLGPFVKKVKADLYQAALIRNGRLLKTHIFEVAPGDSLEIPCP